VYGEDTPTCVRFADRDLRTADADLPVSIRMYSRVYGVPRFSYFDAEFITQCADAYRKVMEHADEVPVEEADFTDAGLGQAGISQGR